MGILFAQEERDDAQHDIAQTVGKREQRHQHAKRRAGGGDDDCEEHHEHQHHGGDAVLVLLRGDGGEQPRLGRGLNLRAGHHDHRHHRRQHAAERAAHDEERDERRGQEALGHLGERRQLSLGHRAERDDGHQDIDHGHDHWSA